jgi:chemotaxis protein MotB
LAEKKSTIVIKKITVVSGGGHGGAWKVAFADFMTAMMCFFLVMWLMATASEPSKKGVADYFSTPSVIEYNFQNYGVEITLEKLFLDLVNEPLKTLQSFLEPMDRTPNIMGMGMKKVVISYLADQLGAVAKNVEVSEDKIAFEIPDTFLFEKGNATPNAKFIKVMDQVKGITMGLESTDVIITSIVFQPEVANADLELAKNVSRERLDILKAKIEASFGNETDDVIGHAVVRKEARKTKDYVGSSGMVKIEMKQKAVLTDGRKPRPLRDDVFGQGEADHSVYDNFVKQMSESKKHQAPRE